MSDRLSASQAAFDFLGSDIPQAPSTHAQLMARWEKSLGGTPYRLLEVVVGAGENGITRGEAAAFLQVKPDTGTFKNYISTLNANGLIEKRDDRLFATSILFPNAV